ncbi:OLC1v1003715C1 [Oldenlandia corymbosa var. corymbosa]|uniref:OLC1v1003715C1 n=1 Tax=Oldenlandia corymbosa var. corymbosa TaxID=529605 RepID=A0AAV1DAN3_OLDCO|nr:OLC1v1003715C1 [Oldenlandia corymbosa var. corymbosa]
MAKSGEFARRNDHEDGCVKEQRKTTTCVEENVQIPKHLEWLFPRDKGFTTVGFIFKGGVYFTADHPYKSYVPNIVPLNSRTFATLSGGCEIWLRVLQHRCQLCERRRGGKRISVL